MKLLLDIEDHKALQLLEILKGLPYVKTKKLTEEKAEVMAGIAEAVEELIREGKLKGIPAEEMLHEL